MTERPWFGAAGKRVVPIVREAGVTNVMELSAGGNPWTGRLGAAHNARNLSFEEEAVAMSFGIAEIVVVLLVIAVIVGIVMKLVRR